MDSQQINQAVETGKAIASMSWEQWVSLVLFVFVAPHLKAIYARAADAAIYLVTGQQSERKRVKRASADDAHARDEWRQEIAVAVRDAASEARRAAEASERTAAELQRVNLRLERGDGELKALRRDVDRHEGKIGTLETICRTQHGG